MHKDKTLVLVDGSSLAFRSFFALFTSGLRSKSGVPTWAILGFFNSLFDLIEKYQPHMMAVCFDLAEPTFRHIEFEDYKAHRTEMPDDLAVQWPLIKEGVEVLGLPVYELAGYEADDVIGSLARMAEEQKINVLILTGDQDAFQLVDGHGQQIKVLMPGKGGLQQYGREEVFQKLSVWPEQIIDYKGLCGDSSDNIPGVKGIGPKTAVQLLTEFKNMESIYENIDKIKSQSVKQKLIDGKKSAFDSKRLATIRLDVPIKFDLDHCLLTAPSLEKVSSFFTLLDFRSIVTRLPKVFSYFKEVSLNAVQESVVAKAQAAPTVDKEGQLTLGFSSTPPKDNGMDKISSTSNFAWQIVENEKELNVLIDKLNKHSVFAFNVQAVGPDWMNSEIYGYTFAWCDELTTQFNKQPEFAADHKKIIFHAAYIPMKSLDGVSKLDPEQVNKKIKPLLEKESIGKIVYNSKQVSNLLFAHELPLEPVIFDPMLASYVVSSDEKHSLKEQADRLLNYAPERLTNPTQGSRKQIGLDQIPPLKIAEYAVDDARVILVLTHHYLSIMDKEQKFLLYEMELPLSRVLASVEQTGMALDVSYLTKFSKELNDDISKLESKIYEHAKHPFNINSPQQLGKILFEELGLEGKVKTKTGYSTDASVLESLREEHSIIECLLEYRQLTKLRSTYVDAMPKLIWQKDNRLHGELNQTVTSTGRLSGSNPNLQNIPIRTEIGRRVRRAFIPEHPDSVLLSADYSQIELRLLAHMSQDKTLIDAFEKDQDVHARTAGEIFDLSIKEVTSEMRGIGKTLNFALIYQQGPFATAKQLGITTKEASAFIEKYFKRYSSVRQFLDKTIEEAKKTGYVETTWKRRRYFKYLNEKNDVLRRAEERAACNAPLQGSAADLMKLAMIKLDQKLNEKKLKTKLILQVHDELVLEVPKEELEEVKEIVRESMLMGQPLIVPLKVDMGVAKNWMEVK